MIEFSSPPISLTLAGYMELGQMWEECSPCAGFCVALGERFFSSGYKEVDLKVLPRLKAKAPDGVTPRVLLAYSMLYWFSLEVCLTLSSKLIIVNVWYVHLDESLLAWWR